MEANSKSVSLKKRSRILAINYTAEADIKSSHVKNEDPSLFHYVVSISNDEMFKYSVPPLKIGHMASRTVDCLHLFKFMC